MATARRDLGASSQAQPLAARWVGIPENSGYVNYTPALAIALDESVAEFKRVNSSVRDIPDDPVEFFTRCRTGAARLFVRLAAHYYRDANLLGGPRRPENYAQVVKTINKGLLSLSLEAQRDVVALPNEFGSLTVMLRREVTHPPDPPQGFIREYAGYGEAAEEGLPIVTPPGTAPRLVADRFNSAYEKKRSEALSEVRSMLYGMATPGEDS